MVRVEIVANKYLINAPLVHLKVSTAQNNLFLTNCENKVKIDEMLK